MSETAEKKCFVICPIGEEGSDTRKRSDQVLKHVIKPAADAAGYLAERADEIDKPGLITSQVIQRVVGDDLVIADLTDMNPNVFYELAIRHAARKPLVQIIEKGQRIPFDVAATRTIHIDHKDLDSVAAAKEEISKQIKSLEKDPSDVETPIAVSLDLQQLRQSEDPEDRSLAEVLSEIAELRITFSKFADYNSSKIDEEIHRLKDILAETRSRFGYRSVQIHRMIPDLFFEPTILSGVDKRTHRTMAYGALGAALKENIPWLSELCLDLQKKFAFSSEGTALKAEVKFKALVRDYLKSPLSSDFANNDRNGPRLLEALDFISQR